MNDPTIPLWHAELLHVAMSTAVHVLEQTTDYPVKNIESVVSAYRISRDKHLKSLGYTPAQIKSFTEAAADALVTWLEGREESKNNTVKDFEAWARELMDE